jgi:hypothetical protein
MTAEFGVFFNQAFLSVDFQDRLSLVDRHAQSFFAAA